MITKRLSSLGLGSFITYFFLLNADAMMPQRQDQPLNAVTPLGNDSVKIKEDLDIVKKLVEHGDIRDVSFMSKIWGAHFHEDHDWNMIPDKVGPVQYTYRVFSLRQIPDPKSDGYILAEMKISFDQCLTMPEVNQIESLPTPPLVPPEPGFSDFKELYPPQKQTNGTFLRLSLFEDKTTGCLDQVVLTQTS